ncbi:hypothetical protein [Gracilibacillus dipsosauri]|uniref:hypothetical protein n=1 Tax=Gracilibacillus dipsosauri TaxID=178340 RepID=UPI0024090F81
MEKETHDMPIWQNHEQRITALEVTQANMKHEFKEIKDAINHGNITQLKKLDEMNNRLFEEFFAKKKINLSNGWKLLFTVLGGGSFLYLLIEKLISF